MDECYELRTTLSSKSNLYESLYAKAATVGNLELPLEFGGYLQLPAKFILASVIISHLLRKIKVIVTKWTGQSNFSSLDIPHYALPSIRANTSRVNPSQLYLNLSESWVLVHSPI